MPPYAKRPRRALRGNETLAETTMNKQTADIIDAAFDVAVFSKTHTYPRDGTSEFFEFADELDALATAINAAYPSFNRNIAASRPESQLRPQGRTWPHDIK